MSETRRIKFLDNTPASELYDLLPPDLQRKVDKILYPMLKEKVERDIQSERDSDDSDMQEYFS